jgi:hypothetical protein
MAGRKSSTLADRFWEKVDRTGDCWLWTASLQPSGYGQFRVPGGVLLAHRVAYELLVGAIPDGLFIDHLCRVRNCVNPAHLEPVTNQENSRRGNSVQTINARKTHCKYGHLFDEENTYHRPDSPGRACRTCIRNRNARRSSP